MAGSSAQECRTISTTWRVRRRSALNSQTALYSIVCSVGGFLGRVDGDHEIDGNQCIHVPYQATFRAATRHFLSFLCFINPTDPLLVWYTKNHSMELPID